MRSRPDQRVNQQDGVKYWEGVEADVDGMLGGYAFISDADILGSQAFLAKLGIRPKGTKNSEGVGLDILEGGAG